LILSYERYKGSKYLKVAVFTVIIALISSWQIDRLKEIFDYFSALHIAIT